jgi:hypothetical protein
MYRAWRQLKGAPGVGSEKEKQTETFSDRMLQGIRKELALQGIHDELQQLATFQFDGKPPHGSLKRLTTEWNEMNADSGIVLSAAVYTQWRRTRGISPIRADPKAASIEATVAACVASHRNVYDGSNNRPAGRR